MKHRAKPPPQTIERLLYDRPSYLIRRLQQAAIAIFQKETSDFSITSDQYAVIAVVSVFPHIDQLRLANAAGLDRTTISGLIDRLEAKGLVVRSASVSDRRAKLISLTAKGAQLLTDITVSIDRAQCKILAPITTQERKVFLKTLDRLVTSHNSGIRTPPDVLRS